MTIRFLKEPNATDNHENLEADTSLVELHILNEALRNSEAEDPAKT